MKKISRSKFEDIRFSDLEKIIRCSYDLGDIITVIYNPKGELVAEQICSPGGIITCYQYTPGEYGRFANAS